MLKFLKIFALFLIGWCGVSSMVFSGEFGLGRTATEKQITAWDIDVRPDGKGLPEGRGSVVQGEQIFIEKCATCHGEFGEGRGRWPVLAGGRDTIGSDDPVKTIGSYWPYLSTVYDYIYRAMPFGDAQSLKPNEVYGIIAYLLNMNELVGSNFVLSKQNFTSVRLPNENNFIDDNRPDTSKTSDKKPCMKNCKKEVSITGRARVVDVTPENASTASDVE